MKRPTATLGVLCRGTRADSDEQLLRSWLDSLNSPHTRRNFETTVRRFLAALPMSLRAGAVARRRAIPRHKPSAAIRDRAERKCFVMPAVRGHFRNQGGSLEGPKRRDVPFKQQEVFFERCAIRLSRNKSPHDCKPTAVRVQCEDALTSLSGYKSGALQ